MSQYYKKYMKKREEEKPSYLKLFIGAFLIMIVFFVIVATHLTSGVDTSIGENDEGDIKETGLGVKHLIDSRLRFIQMEDISSPVTKKEKEQPETIQQYGQTVQEEKDKGYEGNLKNSYGYEPTQQTKPYSQTYTTTQKTVTPPAQTTPAKTVNIPTYTPVKTTAPTPTTHTTTPTHSLQKNLAPTGMN